MELYRGLKDNMVQFYNHTIALPLYLRITTDATPEVSDDFLMYTYKVRRCSKTRSHDWTNCPYAHRGEKARRRDPRKFPYHGIACPEFRTSGECRRGQNCEYAHGVFEFWLHPSRYRTRVCEGGLACPRRICFFAHTPEQLRPEVIRDCFRCELHGHAVNTAVKDGRIEEASASSATTSSTSSFKGGMKGVKVRNGADEDENHIDFPDIEWIVELVK